MAYDLVRVSKIPMMKHAGKLGDGSVQDTLYRFIASDMEYARVDDYERRHANSNNLRKTFANIIKSERLGDKVEVTIRGDKVFLRRIFGYQVEE